MLRQSYILLSSHCRQSFCLRTMVTDVAKPKWDLFVGVQIERLPIISKSLNKLEQDYQDLLMRLEFENSHKSDFELQHERDVAMAQLLKEGKLKIDLDAVSTLTTSDKKDMWKEELSKFQPTSRTTEADKKNDTKSTDRKLEDSLTLIIEQQLGKSKLCILPQGKIEIGETLYQAAQRIIKEHCGDNFQTHIYGNAPCGFYKYKYPEADRKKAIGAKVFFYRAIWKSGTVDDKTKNFEWLSRTELLEKVQQHKSYKKILSQFIF